MAIPFRSHPLYLRRKILIIIAVIGIVLSALSIPIHQGECIIATLLFLIISVIFCAADLYCYAAKKLQQPDEDPKWPLRRWMAGDLILAILLQYLFWITVAILSWDSYYGPNIVGLYAALADLLCS